MNELQHQRTVRHRVAVLRHAAEVTGNVAMTCRYFGISMYLKRCHDIKISQSGVWRILKGWT